jgi:hypothetical protein
MATIFKTTSAIESKGIQYPKRTLLANLSHGSITIDKRKNPKTFVVPEGISIKRAWASAPGICNFISSSNNLHLVARINENKRDLERTPFSSVDGLINNLLEYFKENDSKEIAKPILSEINAMKRGPPEAFDPDFERYHHGFDKFWNLSTYMPGDTVINKKYERTNSEATRREWKCLFLNAPGISEQDLLTLMRPQLRGDANTFVYLSDIVNYLQSNGVKEIILFDFSCSPFLDENNVEFTDEEREIRYMRNNIMISNSPGKFGGKKRQSRRKRKQNKRKKTKRRR